MYCLRLRRYQPRWRRCGPGGYAWQWPIQVLYRRQSGRDQICRNARKPVPTSSAGIPTPVSVTEKRTLSAPGSNLDNDLAARRRELDRIVKQIHEDSPDPIGIGHDLERDDQAGSVDNATLARSAWGYSRSTAGSTNSRASTGARRSGACPDSMRESSSNS